MSKMPKQDKETSQDGSRSCNVTALEDNENHCSMNIHRLGSTTSSVT